MDIAHQIGCCERTVAREVAPTGRVTKPRASKLDPFKPIIDQLLADNVWNAEMIFQLFREQGYAGGSTLVLRYIQPKRVLRPNKQTVCFETPPGFQLQHDWGEIETVVVDQRCKDNVAVNTLGYSRRCHVWAAPSQDAEHIYEGLVQTFRYFGGVPRTVLVDNQKAAVLTHDRDHRVIFNASFLQLANHYGFAPKACRPQCPRTKGKTERMVGYVKQHFFQRYRAFESVAHLSQLLLQWLERVADQRHCGSSGKRRPSALRPKRRPSRGDRQSTLMPATTTFAKSAGTATSKSVATATASRTVTAARPW